MYRYAKAGRRTRHQIGHGQVAAACKQIARLIHSHGLTTGDRLPSQEELRRLLRFSHDTLSPAMRHLVQIGLIKRSTSHGTVICDMDTLNHLTWTVGLTALSTPLHGAGAFHAWLMHALLRELAQRHCVGITFFRVERPHWPHRLEDFPGLAESIADHNLDALVDLCGLDSPNQSALARTGIPVLHSGIHTEMPFAALCERAAMVGEAAAILIGRGARRLALVGKTETLDSRGFSALAQRAATASGGRGAVTEVIPAKPSIASGEQVAAGLLQRPTAGRPDALIVIDDFTGAGLVRILAAHGSYTPRLAVYTNKQLPQTWAMPVMRFEVDIDELAALTIRMLGELLLNPSMPPRQDRVRARMVGE